VRYGIVTSEAGEFPIIDGILRLLTDEFRTPITEFLRQKKFDQALLTALEMPFMGKIGSALNLLSRMGYRAGFDSAPKGTNLLKQKNLRAFTNNPKSLQDALRHFRSKDWINSQLYRFSMRTFLSVYPLLHVVRGHHGVLDFGCGLGHGAFLISRMFPGTPITCVDYSFIALYLAQKYIVEDAEYLCLDGNHLLPFDKDYFSTVFSSDALHFIDGKLSLSNEFMRIVRDDGVLIIPHLHNGCSTIRYAKSLSPTGYDRLFAGHGRRVMPESDVISQFLCEDILNLQKEWDFDRIEKDATGVSIVVSEDDSVFRIYDGLRARHVLSVKNAVINPLYDVDPNDGKVAVVKKPIDEHFGAQLHFCKEIYLPDRYNFDNATLNPQGVNSTKLLEPDLFRELVDRFILIDVPERFCLTGSYRQPEDAKGS